MRDLFTTIDGRVDVAVLVTDEGSAAADSFLGFNIADLEVIRYQPRRQDPSGASALPVQHALS